jgi:hypothetical protein
MSIHTNIDPYNGDLPHEQKRAAITARRRRYLTAGYVPLPVQGKKPVGRRWQKGPTDLDIIGSWRDQFPQATNTGIRTATTPAIDIDITDARMADLAQAVVLHTIPHHGTILKRTGLPPKRLIPFRCDTPFKKIKVHFADPDGVIHAVEVLGDGQQFVAEGVHPDTGKPYQWEDLCLIDVAHERLPLLDKAIAHRVIAEISRAIEAEGWIAVDAKGRPKAVAQAQADQADKPKTQTGGNGPSANGSDRHAAYAQAALQGCARDLADTKSGDRNDTLNAVAYRMGTMAARGWVTKTDVHAALIGAAQQCGLIADDGHSAAGDTFESGFNAGLEAPHEDLEDRPHNGRGLGDNGRRADAPRPGGEGDLDLAKMNERYAVVMVGGKTRVVSFEDGPTGYKVPVYSTFSDFRAFHAGRKLLTSKSGITRRVRLGGWWLDSERRRQYNGIVYSPDADVPGAMNLWTGFSCEPIAGARDLYLDHLRDNICAGDAEHYEYLLNWMAYAVQYPGRQGEVAVVMRGKEGTGKGKAAKKFGDLFGAHFRHIVHAQHLTGHFNAHLQQCSALFGDEAFFAGDRAHESILKALITEETLLIEPKGIDPFPVRNCIHLIMSSNADWVVPAGADARRYFVLNVSDAHMQDLKYFAAIDKQMDSGGREALLHLLLNRDLSGFNVRAVPQTKALAEQKAHSRRGIDRLLEQAAHNGVLPSVHIGYPDISLTSGEPDGKGLYHAAKSLVPDLRYVSSVVIAKALREEWECIPWKSGAQRGLRFPTLARLRELFDQKHGPQDWDDQTEWDIG